MLSELDKQGRNLADDVFFLIDPRRAIAAVAAEVGVFLLHEVFDFVAEVRVVVEEFQIHFFQVAKDG